MISSVEAVETHRSAGENAVLRRGQGALQPFAHHTGRAREECSGCGSLRGLIRTPIHVGEPGEIETPEGDTGVLERTINAFEDLVSSPCASCSVF